MNQKRDIRVICPRGIAVVTDRPYYVTINGLVMMNKDGTVATYIKGSAAHRAAEKATLTETGAVKK